MPKILIQEDGVSKSEKRTINFVSGTNVTITVTDDTTNNQVDVQVDAAGASGAPATVDYLVGTASADLSAEIVVGTTPGGELGGTWGSPTVDTTHSGSSHAGVIATHEAAGDPHTGYRLESADHTHQTTGLQAGQLDHGAALTGLTDDDHTQYILHSLATAGGSLLRSSGAGVFAELAIGGSGTVLTSNGTTASWQTPGAASHPAFISHNKYGVD